MPRLVLIVMAGCLGVTVCGAEDVLIERLCNIEASVAHRYGARDDRGAKLDCVDMTQLKSGRLLGVYHTHQGGSLSLCLGESDDALHWRHLTRLDEHASQGSLTELPDGSLLLAYEKDAPGQCWIRLRRYADVDSLEQGTHSEEYDLRRTLAPTAEGTPMVRSVALDDQNHLESVDLRFHYYKNQRVDQLAEGRLLRDSRWQTRSSEAANSALKRLGARGNLGDRDAFQWRGKTHVLQELQMKPHDWASWRVALCDAEGSPLALLPIATHEGSRAFANPHAATLTLGDGLDCLAVSLFMPSEGSAPGEAGTLIYLIDRREPTSRVDQGGGEHSEGG